MLKAGLHVCILRALLSKENLACNFEKNLSLLNSLHSDSKSHLTDSKAVKVRFLHIRSIWLNFIYHTDEPYFKDYIWKMVL